MDGSSTLMVALSSRDVSTTLPVLGPKDLWALIHSSSDEGRSPGEALADGESAWLNTLKPDQRDAVAARLQLVDDASQFLAQAGERGIWATTPFEENWPTRINSRSGSH